MEVSRFIDVRSNPGRAGAAAGLREEEENQRVKLRERKDAPKERRSPPSLAPSARCYRSGSYDLARVAKVEDYITSLLCRGEFRGSFFYSYIGFLITHVCTLN